MVKYAIEIFACVLFIIAIGLVLSREISAEKWCKEQGYNTVESDKGKLYCATKTRGPEVKR
jgi:hypothetical protein